MTQADSHGARLARGIGILLLLILGVLALPHAAQAQVDAPSDRADWFDIPPLEGGELIPAPVFVDPDNVWAAEVVPSAAPVITIWYGNTQRFGHHGRPITWVNVLGNVSPSNNLTLLQYKLNNGSFQDLDVGPTERRIFFDGDFSVEIPYTELQPGNNTVTIKAVNTNGDAAERIVTLTYTANKTWPLPYHLDWEDAGGIDDVAQVTDGLWAIEGNTLRSKQYAYDRLVVIGHTTWGDFEVTVPVTIHAISNDDKAYLPSSGGPGVGIIMRWQGHFRVGGDQQLTNGWWQLGVIDWFRWRKTEQGDVFGGLARIGGSQDVKSNVVPEFDVTYLMKAQVRNTSACGGDAQYKFKVWEQGDTEPSDWNFEGCEEDTNGEASPTSGSFALVAHHVDASFGPVSVTAPNTPRPTLSVTSTSNGSASAAPVYPDYTYLEKITATATPSNGFVFVGWTGDIVSNANPLVFNITENTQLVANFAEAAFSVTVTQDGSGTVSKTPNQSTYADNALVTLTATPADGWQFVRWEGDQTGTNPVLSFNIIQDTTVNVVFEQAFYALTTEVVDDNGTPTSAAGRVSVTPPQDGAGYAPGAQVTVNAVANPGWQFLRWEGAITGSAIPVVLTMTGDTTLTAVFGPAYYSLMKEVVNENGAATPQAGAVTLAPAQNAAGYAYGEDVSVQAIAAIGWEFVRWEGALTSTAAQTSLTVTESGAVRAVFRRLQYSLETNAVGQGAVSTNVSGPYPHGTSVTATAVAAAKWTFVQWLGDILPAQANTPSVTLVMDGDKSIIAVFEVDETLVYLPFVTR